MPLQSGGHVVIAVSDCTTLKAESVLQREAMCSQMTQLGTLIDCKLDHLRTAVI